ncbi:hypothetical protein [Nocardia sp. NBC_01009]|uniref:hypothetical protein n=1 Tax=Nocardia sp. NBC_01009 TaxID=2975996 RepID=UPI003868C882|nr:hypothetical protein OHA42_14530 [Nocardia sp. NBC_01009]
MSVMTANTTGGVTVGYQPERTVYDGDVLKASVEVTLVGPLHARLSLTIDDARALATALPAALAEHDTTSKPAVGGGGA